MMLSFFAFKNPNLKFGHNKS